ncbi:hypothetical protein ACH5RR_028255 [Cinchona calisaya]|uniref:Uncharacterized protein n=1 Tax=Cinchona calisaya TaxID=153742 RepID=A0ABD2YS19_9GENT
MAYSLTLSFATRPIYLPHMSSPSSSNRFFPCKAKTADQNLPPSDAACSQNGKTSVGKIERRNLLLGMGGLYGATTLTTNPFAFAKPISPDFSDCTSVVEANGGSTTINCCPPSGTEITDFVVSATQIYERKPAHKASDAYIQQYSKAITKMKNLNLTDPRFQYLRGGIAVGDGCSDWQKGSEGLWVVVGEERRMWIWVWAGIDCGAVVVAAEVGWLFRSGGKERKDGGAVVRVVDQEEVLVLTDLGMRLAAAATT